MNEPLEHTFGYCIIPENTLLYRGHSDQSFQDCMFFATNFWNAASFKETVQVWKATREIRVLFLVEYVFNESHTISSLPRLYKAMFPSEQNQEFNDLDIKHWDIGRRNSFIKKLFDEHGISGWFTPIESGKANIEVCLFDAVTNSKQLFLIESCGRQCENYFEESLIKIRVLPTTEFYAKSKQQIEKRAPVLSEEPDHFKRYKRMIKAWIAYEEGIGMNKNRAKHFHFYLRDKLEI